MVLPSVLEICPFCTTFPFIEAMMNTKIKTTINYHDKATEYIQSGVKKDAEVICLAKWNDRKGAAQGAMLCMEEKSMEGSLFP